MSEFYSSEAILLNPRADGGSDVEQIPTLFDDYYKQSFDSKHMQVVRSTKKKYISYGRDNQYPNFLEQLTVRSGLHYSIIKSKRALIAGDSIDFIVNESMSNEDAAELKEKAREFIKKIGIDYKFRMKYGMQQAVFGGAYIQEVYGVDENTKRELKKVICDRFRYYRIGVRKATRFGELSEYYWRHINFSRGTRTAGNNAAKAIKTRDWVEYKRENADDETTEEKDEKNENTQNAEPKKKSEPSVICTLLALEDVVRKAYPRPDYETESGVIHICTDAELALFDVSDLRNSLNAAYIVTFRRPDFSHSDEDKEREIREQEREMIREKLTGAVNAQRVIIRRVEPQKNAESSMEITPIPNNNTGERHKIITERKDIGILVAHSLPAPELAGIPNMSRSGLNNDSTRILTALETWDFYSIQPSRTLFDEWLTKIMKENGFNVTAKTMRSKPVVEFIDKDLLQYAWTENEIRELHGSAELTEEKLAEIRKTRPKSSASKAATPEKELNDPNTEVNAE